MAKIRIEPPPSASEYQYGSTPETKAREAMYQLLEAAQMGYTHKIEGIAAQINQTAPTCRELEHGLITYLVNNFKTKRGPLRKLAELGHLPHEALISALSDPGAVSLVNFLIDDLGADPRQIRRLRPRFGPSMSDEDPFFGPFWDALVVLINHGYVYQVNGEEKEWLEVRSHPERRGYQLFIPPVKYLLDTLCVNLAVAMAIADHPEGWDQNILQFLVKTKHALTEAQRELIASELVAREMGC
jgi:hypothetical protein